MLAYLLQVSVCLLAFYLLYLFIFSRETFFGINRWYLMATLLLSMALPLLLWLPDRMALPQETPMIRYTLEPVVVGMQGVQSALVAESVALTWISLLLVIYWAGVLVLGMRFVRELLRIRQIYLTGNVVSRTHGIRLVYSGKIQLPFSFFHFIFLPVDHHLSDRQLEEILAHEKAHASAWHSVDVLIMELTCIFLWLSPLIYLYRNALRHVHEYLADAAVLSRFDVPEYGRLLMSQATSSMQLALTNQFFQSQLKNRILMMTKDKSRRKALLKYAIIVPVALLVTALFAFRQSESTADLDYAMYTDTLPVYVVDEVVVTAFAANVLNPKAIESMDVIDAPTPEQIARYGAETKNGLVMIKTRSGILKDDDDAVYRVVEAMPRFPGCDDSGLSGQELYDCANQKMLEYIYRNVKYPAEAREQGISGKVVAQFVVRENGRITDARIAQSPGNSLSAAVLDVVGKMADETVWHPATQRGVPVPVMLTIPVSYRLESKEDSNDSPAAETGHDEIFRVVEEMPRFPGCEDSDLSAKELLQCANTKLIEFVYERLRYPSAAREAGVEGRVIVQFVVRKDGSVTDAQIVRSIGHGTDEAVLDVIRTMQQMSDRWRPGYQRGQPVNVQFTLPVIFKMSDDTKDTDNVAIESQTLKAPELEALQVFPVPAARRLNYLLTGSTSGPIHIELIATDGRVVHQSVLEPDGNYVFEGYLDAGDVPAGQYTFAVRHAGKMATRNVVFQN